MRLYFPELFERIYKIIIIRRKGKKKAMDKIKKFPRNHYGQSVELKYRMFCICSVLGTLTSFLGAILCCYIAGMREVVSYATIAGFLLMFTLTVLGHKIQKPDIILIIMSSLLNFIVFPVAFLSTGALYSVAPMFFVMGTFIAVPILSGRKRNILFLLQLIFYSGTIATCYFFPQISYVRPRNEHTTMLLFSYIIVAFYMIFATIMITNQYEKDQAKLQIFNGLLENQATLDPLTKLYNRRYLNEFLSGKTQEENARFLVILVDLDDFKNVNDNFGHTTGDKILVCFADAVMEVFPEDCFTCRYGGEEFIIYCSTPDIKLAEYRMSLVKKRFTQQCKEQCSVTVTFSAGGVIYQGKESITDLFDRADALLYEAKRNGKNQFLHR